MFQYSYFEFQLSRKAHSLPKWINDIKYTNASNILKQKNPTSSKQKESRDSKNKTLLINTPTLYFLALQHTLLPPHPI